MLDHFIDCCLREEVLCHWCIGDLHNPYKWRETWGITARMSSGNSDEWAGLLTLVLVVLFDAQMRAGTKDTKTARKLTSTSLGEWKNSSVCQEKQSIVTLYIQPSNQSSSRRYADGQFCTLAPKLSDPCSYAETHSNHCPHASLQSTKQALSRLQCVLSARGRQLSAGKVPILGCLAWHIWQITEHERGMEMDPYIPPLYVLHYIPTWIIYVSCSASHSYVKCFFLFCGASLDSESWSGG